jgi:hypothetical protein
VPRFVAVLQPGPPYIVSRALEPSGRRGGTRARSQDAVDAARAADARGRVARCAADTVAPAVASVVQADQQLRKLVSSDWRALNEFLLPELLTNLLREYLNKPARIDGPPVKPKAPAGVTLVRFVKSYPGSNTYPSIPAYADGETAGLAPAVAARLIEAGYAEVIKDAA